MYNQNQHLWQSNFSKGLAKLAILFDYKRPTQDILPSFATSSKNGPDFSKSYSKKNELLKSYSSKKNQKDSDDFWLKKFTLKCTLR